MRQGGFSLLEILVALAILAAVAGIGLEMMGGAVGATSRAADYRQAVNLADDRLTTLAARNAPTGSEGEEGRFRWRLTTTPLEPSAGSVVAHQLTIEVSWPGQSWPVSLTTVRLRQQ